MGNKLSSSPFDLKISIVTALIKGDSTNREDKDEEHCNRRDYSNDDVAVLSAAHGRPDLSRTTAIGSALFDERVCAHLAYVDLLVSFDNLV